MNEHDNPEKIAARMAKAMASRDLPSKDTKPRPPRSEDVNDMLLECTLTIRDNIAAIIDAEADMGVDDALNHNQLGKMAGYGSSVVYQSLRSEPPRNMIGIQTLARFSLALGLTPHILLMPKDKFKEEIIPAYKLARGARSAKKAPKKE